MQPPVRLGYAGSGVLSVAVTDQVTITAVPAGSQRVPMLTLELTADCGGNRKVEAVTLRRTGLGAASDISGVYAEYRGARVSRARTVSRRDGVLAVPLRGVTVLACETQTLQILADFLPNAAIAGQHRFMLHGGQSIEADAAVIWSSRPAPARRAVPTVSRGILTVETLRAPSSVSWGERQVLGTFRLHAEHRTQYVVRMTLTNRGTAHDADVRNLQLESGGKPVSNIIVFMEGDRAVFTLNRPLAVSRNDDRIIKVYGTVLGSASRTIELVIEEPSDVVAGR